MKGKIVTRNYVVGRAGPLLVLWVRWEDGSKTKEVVRTSHKPYFYAEKAISSEDLKRVIQELKVDAAVYSVNSRVRAIPEARGGLWRIVLKNPKDVPRIRDYLKEMYGVRTYEADVPYTDRWVIDLGITSAIIKENGTIKPTDPKEAPRLRLCALDIEVDDSEGFPHPKDPRYKIISIAVVGEDGKEFIATIYDMDEKELVREALNFMREYDAVLAWNGFKFDFPYLRGRCRRYLNIFVDWEQWQFIDYLSLYSDFATDKPERLALDVVAQHELGKGKVERVTRVSELSPEELREYNLTDARLVMELERKLQFYRLLEAIYDVTGVPPDAFSPARISDRLFLRHARKKGIVLPNAGEWMYGDYTGAVVLEPEPGLHRNVLVLDFKSLYPNVIYTFNVSPETWIPDIDDAPEEGRVIVAVGEGDRRELFRAEPLGFVPEIVMQFMKLRDEFKKLRNEYSPDSEEYRVYDTLQYACKVITNSIYGQYGFKYSRLANWRLAGTVTGTGRYLLLTTKKLVEGEFKGVKVIYGDTDSMFVKVSSGDFTLEELIEVGQELEAFINSRLPKYVIEHNNVLPERCTIKIKFEKLYEKLVLARSKKRYYGKLVWKEGKYVEKLDVAGFEVKRSDWAPIAKHIQRLVMEAILNGAEEEDIMDILEITWNMLISGRLDHMLVITKGLSKDLSEYKADQPHVRAARKYLQKMGELPYDNRISYVFVDDSGTVEPVINGRVPRIKESGYKWYWEHMVLPVVERIIEPLGWRVKKVVATGNLLQWL